MSIGSQEQVTTPPLRSTDDDISEAETDVEMLDTFTHENDKNSIERKMEKRVRWQLRVAIPQGLWKQFWVR